MCKKRSGYCGKRTSYREVSPAQHEEADRAHARAGERGEMGRRLAARPVADGTGTEAAGRLTRGLPRCVVPNCREEFLRREVFDVEGKIGVRAKQGEGARSRA